MSSTSLRMLGLLFLLWLTGLGAGAQFAKIAVPFADLRTLFPDAGTELGWLLTVTSAMGAVLGLTAGVLVARLGCLRVLIWSLLLGAAVSFWQAMLPGLSMMIASRVIEGISHLGLVVATPTLMVQISTDRVRGPAMALWSTFLGVAFVFVAWAGLPFVTRFGLGSLFGAHGAYLLIMAGLLWRAFPRSGQAAVDVSEPFDLRSVFRRHVTGYSSPFISAPSLGWLFYTLTFVSLLAILPTQLPDSSRTVIAGFMPLTSIAVSLFGVPLLLAFLSPVSVVVLGFLVATASVLLFFAGLPLAALCLGLFAAFGIVQGASFASIPYLNSSVNTQTAAYGALAQTGNIGNLIGTPILLWVMGGMGMSWMLIVVACLHVAGALGHLWLAGLRKSAVPS